MTISTETWYTGYDPYTLEPVESVKTPREKLAQRQFFFWYKPEERAGIERELRRIGRPDLIPQLYDHAPAPYNSNSANKYGAKKKDGKKSYEGYKFEGKKKSFNPNFDTNNHRTRGSKPSQTSNKTSQYGSKPSQSGNNKKRNRLDYLSLSGFAFLYHYSIKD